MSNPKARFAVFALIVLQLPSSSNVLAEQANPETPAPLGKLIDVGGHKMHIYTTGHGGPTVILEAGAGAFGLDWYYVQKEVAKFTAVASYDRSGHAWSDLGPQPQTMSQVVHDLHQLLSAANLHGPYVFAGHSLGGAIIRWYSSHYPNEVAGLVLVDTAPENSIQFINGQWVREWDLARPIPITAPRDHIREDERVLSKEALEGYKKFREWMGPPKIEPPYDKLPPEIQKLRLWAMSLPQSNVSDYNAFAAQEGIVLFADRVRSQFPLGDKPVVILSRKAGAQEPLGGASPEEAMARRREKERIEGTKAFTLLSRNSLLVVAEKSGHEIHLDQPDLVIEAIKAVMEAAKNGSKLRSVGSEGL